MNTEDYKVFMDIIELIKTNKLDKLSQICFLTGVLAGLNCDSPEINEYLADIPFIIEDQEDLYELIESIEDYDN